MCRYAGFTVYCLCHYHEMVYYRRYIMNVDSGMRNNAWLLLPFVQVFPVAGRGDDCDKLGCGTDGTHRGSDSQVSNRRPQFKCSNASMRRLSKLILGSRSIGAFPVAGQLQQCCCLAQAPAAARHPPRHSAWCNNFGGL